MEPSTVCTVEVERHGSVALVRLNREAKRNALSMHLESRLLDALHSQAVQTSAAVVVTGGTTVFSAGADVGEIREMTAQDIFNYYRSSGAVYEIFAQLPQPTVAAITGWCLGGGLEFSLAADLRVADPTAIFGLPEVGLGILPSSGGIARLSRAIGVGRMKDLVLRGRRFSATEALDWGLLTEVTAPGEHISRALELAAELAEAPPLAVRVTKQVLDVAVDSPRQATLLLEQLAYAALNRTGTDSSI